MSRRPLLPVLVALALVVGCDTSPTDPLGQSFIFEGQVMAQEVKVHALPLVDTGSIRVEITEISVLDAVIPGGTLGFSLGRPTVDSCSPSFRQTVRTGDSFAFGLAAGDYCIAMFDNGLGPETVVDYTVTVKPLE